nr:MAG TPA_asm: hypothetical protein [Bacteriophage sp.]
MKMYKNRHMNKNKNERTNDRSYIFLNNKIQSCINDYECKHINA